MRYHVNWVCDSATRRIDGNSVVLWGSYVSVATDTPTKVFCFHSVLWGHLFENCWTCVECHSGVEILPAAQSAVQRHVPPTATAEAFFFYRCDVVKLSRHFRAFSAWNWVVVHDRKIISGISVVPYCRWTKQLTRMTQEFSVTQQNCVFRLMGSLRHIAAVCHGTCSIICLYSKTDGSPRNVIFLWSIWNTSNFIIGRRVSTIRASLCVVTCSAWWINLLYFEHKNVFCTDYRGKESSAQQRKFNSCSE